VLNVEKLKNAWPPPSEAVPGSFDLDRLRVELLVYLASDPPEYLDVDRVREALREVYDRFQRWQEFPADQRAEQTAIVRRALDALSRVLEFELKKVHTEATIQGIHARVLLILVTGLTLLHVLVIGSLLRRWLLKPLEQLNRQVAALARDEPPAEPLLRQPKEFATLAAALDQARESLRNLRQQVLESERLTTIGGLAAQLAHNLRNPLASIRASAQITARQSEDPKIEQRMSEVMASVDRLTRWLNGVMEVAKPAGPPTRVERVLPTLEHVKESLAPELRAKGIELELRCEAPDLECPHDPITLEQALVAIIVNAIEASPLDSRILLETRSLSAYQDDSLHQERDTCTRVQIQVTDSGPGLPSDDPERIFEFAYSSKQRGLGLGLALARRAMQRQGGNIHAANRPEGGACVWIELPGAASRPVEN
jgi:signal transduction histidine kinase